MFSEARNFNKKENTGKYRIFISVISTEQLEKFG